MKKQKKPKESPEVGALRDRQIRDLAKLDEEENRRIKAALQTRGTRAFRQKGTDKVSGNVRAEAGSTGAAAAGRSRVGSSNRLGKFLR